LCLADGLEGHFAIKKSAGSLSIAFVFAAAWAGIFLSEIRRILFIFSSFYGIIAVNRSSHCALDDSDPDSIRNSVSGRRLR
jgi:hypothetical protein